MRTVEVAVAVVMNPRLEFLLAYNHKWGRRALPMRDVDPHAEVLPRASIIALEDDLGCRRPAARATDLGPREASAAHCG